ncbi:CRISPR system precrRNA processing endoribonuclease RAMP protein Cas6 [Thermomonas paludicola]|uniref:CRISPR system precrRNA processing endoribonuclease RAMP protein Cas6 n=1 Tax=Thermomonas paludicola TaxID=2884874 RepID=UPI002115A4CB|nr:CRISPR system precrRNA processing endoribonuclease RAMP protein Cas6 [Thermomonas paludicola]
MNRSGPAPALPRAATHAGSGLQLHRYRLRFEATSPAQAPLPLAVVRGSWGAALRRMACSTQAPDCKGCALAQHCGYRAVFDPLPPAGHALGTLSSVPPPYVLSELVPEGRGGWLHLVLLGPAQERLGLALLAMEQACKQGLGRERTPYRVEVAQHWTCSGWQPLRNDRPPPPGLQLLPRPADETQAAPAMQALHIALHSPVRLQDQGRIIRPEDFTPRRWLMALVRRIGLLADLYGEPLELDYLGLAEMAAQVQMSKASLAWEDDARWSGRQQKTHPMGGVIGSFRMEGPLAAFQPLLDAGQWLHVGKHAAFGQGRYRILESTAQ